MIGIFILIIQMLFSVIGYFAWVRFLLQWSNAPIHNIFTQQIVKICRPILKPLQYIVGSYKNYNLTVLLFLWLVNIIEVILFVVIVDHTFPNFGGLLLFALVKMFMQLSYIFLYGTIIYALMSWFPSLTQSPLGQCIIAIIHPLVSMVRKVIPTLGMFDFSPMILVIAIIIIQYVLNYGQQFAAVLAFT